MNLVGPRDRPWWKTINRAGRNPFETLGMEYCTHCKMAVDTDTEAHYQDGVYAYRRRCLRCGQWTNYGIYRIPLLANRLPAAAVQWIYEPGQDRS